jgi:hypothetical protein
MALNDEGTIESGISQRERLLGGLWGALVGDALGVPAEFKVRAPIFLSLNLSVSGLQWLSRGGACGFRALDRKICRQKNEAAERLSSVIPLPIIPLTKPAYDDRIGNRSAA